MAEIEWREKGAKRPLAVFAEHFSVSKRLEQAN